MAKKISAERKAVYYIGMGLIVLGVILFASTVLTFAMNSGGSSNVKSSMFLALGGVVLMIVGVLVREMGARGLAGSGVILDPAQARQELEPYSRMGGGMVKDALDEADINLEGKSEKIIMIKCPSCKKLNEEDSKFCQECGREL